MRNLEKEALSLLREMMEACKAERKAKSRLTNKEIARALDITENYFSALESARATPSVRVLLKYHLCCGFEVAPLKSLVIGDAATMKLQSKDRLALAQKIFSFDDEQVGYMLEQSKIPEVFNLKIKTKKKE